MPLCTLSTQSLTLITSGEACADGLVPVTWNTAAGEQGEQGIPGAQGPQGIQGVQGIPGDSPLTDFFSAYGVSSAHYRAPSECVIGQMILSAANNNGLGMAMGVPANGQLLPIASYTALYSVFGTTYGGNGTTNFAVPNMLPATPYGMAWSICDAGLYPTAY